MKRAGRKDGAWLSLVERSVWDREVASSNLAAPTKPLFLQSSAGNAKKVFRLCRLSQIRFDFGFFKIYKNTFGGLNNYGSSSNNKAYDADGNYQSTG